jgi:hypothetical protein
VTPELVGVWFEEEKQARVASAIAVKKLEPQ